MTVTVVVMMMMMMMITRMMMGSLQWPLTFLGVAVRIREALRRRRKRRRTVMMGLGWWCLTS